MTVEAAPNGPSGASDRASGAFRRSPGRAGPAPLRGSQLRRYPWRSLVYRATGCCHGQAAALVRGRSRPRIDSIWWNWGEGNIAPYPSDILPLYDHPGYRQWVDDGVDIVRVFQEETQARGIEVFFSHRMNGSDNDLYGPVPKIPLKEAHPDWLFRCPGVRMVTGTSHCRKCTRT